MVRLVYRKISDPNSRNNTKDVHFPKRNWTDIFNVNDNDRYEITLIVYNNEDLSAATTKHLFSLMQGILYIFNFSRKTYERKRFMRFTT